MKDTDNAILMLERNSNGCLNVNSQEHMFVYRIAKISWFLKLKIKSVLFKRK